MIFDPATGKEIDYEKVADLSKLVLNVDLWNLHGIREDNCVKHGTSSPSISSVTTAAYPLTLTGATSASQQAQPYNGSNIPSYSNQPFTSPSASSGPSSASSFYTSDDQRSYGNGGQNYGQRNPPNPYNDPRYNPQYPNGYEQPYNARSSNHGSVSSASQIRSARSSQDSGQPSKDAQIAKNLIGSASSSAFRLVDDKGKVGLWFVLQDLSVRTEGWFRLKMNLFNLAEFVVSDDGNKANSSNVKLLDEAPCLATAFSQPFKVFSAKKFPGVIETTNLSRQFAKQGIKIPIRKDGNSKKRKGGGEEAEEEEVYEDDF